MERREFLAGLAGLSAMGVAGCVAHPDSVLVFEEVNDRELADRATHNAENVEREIDELNVAAELFENGTYTWTGRWEPINTKLPYVYEGEYYTVDVETSTAPPDVMYDIEAEYVGDEQVEGETEYEQLPEADREALSFLNSAEITEEGYNDTVEHLYEAGADEESTIVSGTTVVVVGERRFSVEAGESNDIERQEFSYTSQKIASSRDEFVSWLNDEYRFELSGLSDEERAIVEEAIGEGYYEGSSNEAFRSVVETFQEHDAVKPEEEGGYWLVEYEGTTYWVDLRY